MTFEQWEQQVPQEIREDALWRTEAYRLGLFLFDLAWQDALRLTDDRRAKALTDQLLRSVGNISSSIAEGYSRGTGRDRARFYEYSLGSVRESRDWYYKCREVLDPQVINHRLDLTTQLIRLLIRMISNERQRNTRLQG